MKFASACGGTSAERRARPAARLAVRHNRVGPGATAARCPWDSEGPARATRPGRSFRFAVLVRIGRVPSRGSAEDRRTGGPRSSLPPAGSPIQQTAFNATEARSQAAFTDWQGMDVMKLKLALVALGALVAAGSSAQAGGDVIYAGGEGRNRGARADPGSRTDPGPGGLHLLLPRRSRLRLDELKKLFGERPALRRGSRPWDRSHSCGDTLHEPGRAISRRHGRHRRLLYAAIWRRLHVRLPR